MAMDIGEAVEAMQKGKLVARDHWEGKTLGVLDPGANAKMTKPYIYEDNGDGSVVPWCPSHAELLATDWMVIDADE